MWFLIRAIIGGLLGSATSKWFRKTRLGVKFYNKVDSVYKWVVKKYDLQILTKEEKLIRKFPNLSARIAKLEARIRKLEKK